MTMDEYIAADAEAVSAIEVANEAAHIESLIGAAAEDGRKLVTVRIVDSIDDIPGADLIKVATVGGWKVVVKAGEFQAGDMCVFLEVDTFIQATDERFAFLAKNEITWQGVKGYRLRSIRLRKQLSQGLALPLNLFPEIEAEIAGTDEDPLTMNFTKTLRVMKWEKVMSAQLAGQAKGNFPSFLRKSDQERAQNMGQAIFGYEDVQVPFETVGIPTDALNNMLQKGELVKDWTLNTWFKVRKATASRDTRYEVTMKLDGSSMTMYVHGDQRGVCSRNLDLKMDEENAGNSFVQMANSGLLDLISQVRDDVAVQGELLGTGIQGNPEGFTFNHFFIYNVFDIQTGEFMTPPERGAFVRELRNLGTKVMPDLIINHVPILHANVTLEMLGIKNMEDLLKFADGPSINAKMREGVVFKAIDGKHQWKVVSNAWLLSTGD